MEDGENSKTPETLAMTSHKIENAKLREKNMQTTPAFNIIISMGLISKLSLLLLNEQFQYFPIHLE